MRHGGETHEPLLQYWPDGQSCELAHLSEQLPLMHEVPFGHSELLVQARSQTLLRQSLLLPAQVPQRIVPPHPSEVIPQFLPSVAQVDGRHVGSVLF